DGGGSVGLDVEHSPGDLDAVPALGGREPREQLVLSRVQAAGGPGVIRSGQRRHRRVQRAPGRVKEPPGSLRHIPARFYRQRGCAAPAVCCPGSDDRPQRPVPSFEETMILPRTLTAPRVRALLRALAFALLSLAPLALAQGQAVEPVAGSPEAVADAAVRSWLERVPVGVDQLSRL